MTHGARCFVRLVLACALMVTTVAARSESHVPSLGVADANMVSEFNRTCVASKSMNGLKDALSIGGWKAFASLAESHLEREIAAVTPMLEAQGLASDYVIYWRDSAGRRLELALSETKKAVSGDRKLVGCSIYDFGAKSPIDSTTLSVLSSTVVGKKGTIGDVQVEKWDGVFGEGSEMRAVFVPASSAIRAQLGFSGMMLGTHFLDAVQ